MLNTLHGLLRNYIYEGGRLELRNLSFRALGGALTQDSLSKRWHRELWFHVFQIGFHHLPGVRWQQSTVQSRFDCSKRSVNAKQREARQNLMMKLFLLHKFLSSSSDLPFFLFCYWMPFSQISASTVEWARILKKTHSMNDIDPIWRTTPSRSFRIAAVCCFLPGWRSDSPPPLLVDVSQNFCSPINELDCCTQAGNGSVSSTHCPCVPTLHKICAISINWF